MSGMVGRGSTVSEEKRLLKGIGVVGIGAGVRAGCEGRVQRGCGRGV
jgi:hypothetical protein